MLWRCLIIVTCSDQGWALEPPGPARFELSPIELKNRARSRETEKYSRKSSKNSLFLTWDESLKIIFRLPQPRSRSSQHENRASPIRLRAARPERSPVVVTIMSSALNLLYKIFKINVEEINKFFVSRKFKLINDILVLTTFKFYKSTLSLILRTKNFFINS